MSSSVISFFNSPFTYTITFSPDDTMMEISCSHSEEYFTWSKIIDQDIITEFVDLKTSNLHLKVSPVLLFKLITEFKNGSLDPIYKFKFPEAYKTWDTSLVIELITRIPYETTTDHKIIILDPVTVSDSDRFNFKLAHVKDIMEQNNNNTISSLTMEIKDLKDQVANLKNEMHGVIKEYATKAGLIAHDSKFATKAELTAHDTKYATKTELTSLDADLTALEDIYATKAGLIALDAKFATKTELTALDAKFATKAEIKTLDTKFVAK